MRRLRPLALLALCSSPAVAAEAMPCPGARPWIAVELAAAGPLGPKVLRDLRAGLEPSRIDACDIVETDAKGPLAVLVVKESATGAALFSIDVTDAVTRKRIGRDVDLAGLPADGRALALAVAAEELLRASWVEVAPPSSPAADSVIAPPEVRAVVARGKRTESKRRSSGGLGARFAIERFTGGQTHLGVDLFASKDLAGQVAVLGAMGARRGLLTAAPHGTVEASAFSADLGLAWSRELSPALTLAPFVGVRLLRLTLAGTAMGDASAASSTGWVVTARAGTTLLFGVPALLRSYTTLGAGWAARSLAASDAGEIVTGASGAELFASTGVALELM